MSIWSFMLLHFFIEILNLFKLTLHASKLKDFFSNIQNSHMIFFLQKIGFQKSLKNEEFSDKVEQAGILPKKVKIRKCGITAKWACFFLLG